MGGFGCGGGRGLRATHSLFTIFVLGKTTSNSKIREKSFFFSFRGSTLLCALVPYRKIVGAIPKLSALAVYSENGELLEVYQVENVTAPWLSEGETMGGYQYLGSWFNPFLARVKVGELAS